MFLRFMVLAMRLMRSLTGALLALTLVLTSFSAGVARGQSAPVDVVEICRGLTVTSIAIDAEGHPVGHVHLCDDGLMALFADVGMAAPILPLNAVWQAVDTDRATVTGVTHEAPRPAARGPPLFL